jgi:hypothetical protein
VRAGATPSAARGLRRNVAFAAVIALLAIHAALAV